MNQQEEIKLRIIDLLTICKLSKKDFCDYIGITPCNFGRYLEKNSISYDDVLKYERLGINLRYLLMGKGNIYTNNKNGRKVKHLYNIQRVSEENSQNYRLKYWINTHYKSIDLFEEQYNISKEKYFESKSNDFQIPIKLKKVLSHAGLNIKWLYSKNECPYNYTENAKIKKNWLLENCTSDNLMYLEMKGII